MCSTQRLCLNHVVLCSGSAWCAEWVLTQRSGPVQCRYCYNVLMMHMFRWAEAGGVATAVAGLWLCDGDTYLVLILGLSDLFPRLSHIPHNTAAAAGLMLDCYSWYWWVELSGTSGDCSPVLNWSVAWWWGASTHHQHCHISVVSCPVPVSHLVTPGSVSSNT